MCSVCIQPAGSDGRGVTVTCLEFISLSLQCSRGTHHVLCCIVGDRSRACRHTAAICMLSVVEMSSL